jgi:4-hydroxy-2-oxoheptanedioate aldolase
MQATPNRFKQNLLAGRPQIGLWGALSSPYVTELLASIGFDWLLIDNEHAPNDVRSTLAQLQAVAPYAVQPVVRLVEGQVHLIKQHLDIGAQNLLIPMVESAEQATALVAAVRYPPRGVRGVGSALARASRWNQIEGYLLKADAEICLMVQVESVAGLANLAAIAAVQGVDGVFFGPGDLCASMGLIGQQEHPQVVAAIRAGIDTVKRAGKAPGMLSANPQRAKEYLQHGATFVAVGSDTTLLVRAATELLSTFKNGTAAHPSGKY